MENNNVAAEQAEVKKVFCVKCGKEMSATSTFCPHCGHAVNANVEAQPAAQPAPQAAPQPAAQPQVDASKQKSKLVAALLAIFLGAFGVHNFYLGFTKKAVIQLVVSLVGSVLTVGIATTAIGVWALVEALMLLTDSVDKDANGVPLK